MIVLTVLFSVMRPQNAESVLVTVMEYVNFDIFETQKHINFVFDFPETAPFNQIFNRAGYNTTTYIIELGAIVHMSVGFAILVPMREIFKRVMKKRETSNRFLQYLKGKSDKMNYEVIIVRFLLEGCIELGLAAMITVIILVKSIGETEPPQLDGRRFLSQGRWTNFEILSNTFAVLTLIGLLASLWWLNRAAKKYFTRRDERTERKYG